MKSLLAIAAALLLPVSSWAQIWGTFPDLPYMNQARPAAASGSSCATSNLFLHIDGMTGSSQSIIDGDFFCQKIKNLSDVAVTIKMVSWPVQTNNSSGPPAWTAYVRDNPDFNSGTTYGSASISTNRSRVGDIWADLVWASGTEPTVPANTDFYIGVKTVLNGATVSQRYQITTGGTGYVDANYKAYSNGLAISSVNTADIGMDIYACFTRPTCVTSNLWASPINQQQLTSDNTRNMTFNAGVTYRQKIHNTATTPIMIKKFRMGMLGNGTAVDTRVAVTSSGNYQVGNQYGYFSRIVNIPSSMTFVNMVDFIWDDGFEPIIPANTDFYVGAFPFANNLVNAVVKDSNTAYETITWNYGVSDVDESRDLMFEVYECLPFACATSNLWSTPILQQQTNDDALAIGVFQNVAHQKIKNTASVSTTVKTVRFYISEGGGSPVDCVVFVKNTSATTQIPELGGYSATNTIAANASGAWRDFIFTDAAAPVVPANTDIWIVLRAMGAGQANIWRKSVTGGTAYQDTTYGANGTTSYNNPTDLDFKFEIYTCQ